ncbi:MAG: aminopeptidase [Spirochaetales bacterium]|nr:aminopeptidase [Spirochaetales bacterium]
MKTTLPEKYSVFAVICLFLPLLAGCYLLKQGSYIISYNMRAKKIDTLIEDPSISPEKREMLSLVTKIKSYAVSTLGLADDKNYTTYVAIDRDYCADVVSASKKDCFEPYTWWYPFFGSFPYKGFFEREDALREAEALGKKGLDVLLRKVDAFSTLGFFTDPVYCYMADYSPYALASLIIHEQTHATIWLSGRIQFNEELATFVGREGALAFISETYGEDSPHYKEAVAVIDDSSRFVRLIKSLYKDLEILYEKDIGRQYKLSARGRIIHAFKERYRLFYRKEFQSEGYRVPLTFPINNAYIMLFITYTEDLSLYYDLFRRQGEDLPSTIALLKQVKTVGGDPKEYIRNVLLADNRNDE